MKKIIIVAGVLLFVLLMAGCGSTDKTISNSTTTAAVQESKKIVVGITSVYPGVSFIDANGNLTGFDVELAKELDKRLPEYEFQFQPMEFGNLLLSLETNKIDFIAQTMNKNEEREKKYLFTKEPYSYFLTKVAVDKNNDGIHSIDDLQGKKLFIGSSTSNNAKYVEDYNNKHDKKIEVVYGNGAANDLVQLIQNKRVDATLQTNFSIRFNKDADGKEALKLVGEPLLGEGVLYVLRKDSQALADKLDEAIRSVKADGTLAQLSVKHLGADFTKSLEEAKKK